MKGLEKTKSREGILYLFFGGLTFFLAAGLFFFLDAAVGIDELVANVISWATGVMFSFFTTRKWVFRVVPSGTGGFFKQLCSFCTARAATLLLQELLLYIFIKKLGQTAIIVKICTEFINIVLNYIVSKWIVFRKG